MTPARQAVIGALVTLALIIGNALADYPLGADAHPARAYWTTHTIG